MFVTVVANTDRELFLRYPSLVLQKYQLIFMPEITAGNLAQPKRYLAVNDHLTTGHSLDKSIRESNRLYVVFPDHICVKFIELRDYVSLLF